MLLTIEKKQSVKTEVHIEVPCYFKSEHIAMAILSENEGVRIFSWGQYHSMSKDTAANIFRDSDTMEPCTQEEFETAYNECLNQFNIFQPA